jgi:two-component system, sensor histidine kinase and response regulator
MKTESKYKYLEAMPQLIILTNSKMHIIYANRLFVDMIERDTNKVLDEPLANLISLPDSFALQDLPTSFVSYFKWDKKVAYEFRVSATEAEKEDESEYLWLVEPVAVSENEKVFFESLFDAVPFGIVLLDKDDKVLECNQAFSRLFLYERNEAVGNMINDLIVPTDLWETGTTLTKAVAQGKPIYSETKRRRRDGTLLDVAIIGKPFTMPDSNQLVFGIYQDIGERLAYREAIQKEKAYFEFLFESIPYGVVLLNAKDDIVDCNSGFCQLFGYEKEDIVGKENINLIFTDKFKDEGIGLRSRVSSGDRVYAESQRKHKDGRLIDVAISGRKLKMEDGSLFIFALYKDITDRKQVERALEENRQQLANLIDNLPGMVYRCRYDEYYTMLYVSESSKRILGYDPEKFTGEKTVNFEQLIHKPYRESIRQMWDMVLAEKTSFEHEYEMDRASGDSIWVWERGRGVFDAAGQLLFLEGYIEDVTVHKLAEQQLQNERDLMQALMDNIPDTIYFKDLESRFVRVNYSQARALGLKHPDDAIGKTDFDFFDHKHAQKSFGDEQYIYKTGDALINEQEHIQTANGWRWFSASKVPLYDAHGKITGLAGVSRDLTAFKNMEQALRSSEQELRKTNKEKDKLFSVIAHDLRSPFNSFLMLTEMFNDDSFGLGVDEIRELTVNMHKSVLSLYDLLDNLLSWSAVQRNKVVVDKSSIGLVSFVNDILSYFRSSINKKNLQIELEVYDDMTIFTDKTMLGSILRNLLSNAIKFSTTGGEILIAAEVGIDGTASISIKDSGIGIPEEMKNNLFTIEAKGRKGTDGEPSSGLGLILVRDFVNLIGGSIEVESQEGKGSIFIVSIPPETND